MAKMIKLKEILNKVPPFSEHKPGGPHYPDVESIERDLGTGTYLGWSEKFNERVKVIPVTTWLCTDTMVGVNAYYFDGEFVALSFQSARKNDVNFYWVSLAAARQLRGLIRALADEESLTVDGIDIIDAEKEVSSDWLAKG